MLNDSGSNENNLRICPLNSAGRNHITSSDTTIRTISSHSTNGRRSPNILTSFESSLDYLDQDTQKRNTVSNANSLRICPLDNAITNPMTSPVDSIHTISSYHTNDRDTEKM
ncbi:hypothetical protein GJ496_010577 [Pomphorhynchus laevis]|nr:hypothetical protein GJ496_010577 [Pomphorhynchus laevis]